MIASQCEYRPIQRRRIWDWDWWWECLHYERITSTKCCLLLDAISEGQRVTIRQLLEVARLAIDMFELTIPRDGSFAAWMPLRASRHTTMAFHKESHGSAALQNWTR